MSTAVFPYLGVTDSVRAVEFYERAFGAVEIGPRLTAPDGRIAHTEVKIGDAIVMLADEIPDHGTHSPVSLDGTCVRLAMTVDDVDAVAARAEEAGAKILIPVADQFYGYRSCRLADPFGHIWIVSTKIEDLTHEEIQRRAAALFSGQ